jgi:hypothetical protein
LIDFGHQNPNQLLDSLSGHAFLIKENLSPTSIPTNVIKCLLPNKLFYSCCTYVLYKFLLMTVPLPVYLAAKRGLWTTKMGNVTRVSLITPNLSGWVNFGFADVNDSVNDNSNICWYLLLLRGSSVLDFRWKFVCKDHHSETKLCIRKDPGIWSDKSWSKSSSHLDYSANSHSSQPKFHFCYRMYNNIQ